MDWLDELIDAIFSWGDQIYDTRVMRNRDKPHRCPRCHDVCLRDQAPRAWTIVACHRCEVWWRYGPTWTSKLRNVWWNWRNR